MGGSYRSSAEVLYLQVYLYLMGPPYHLEIWHIAVICLLMLPAFFIANYLLVKKMVQERRIREDRVERFVAASVSRDMSPENRSRKRPRRRL
ncbi:hypothetical protein Mhar_0422 [Methanothrix harundinacea 6Ac]|uniref:Uncharacterized protein n=2 Tax=Methanothrix harundinacea TaxID=301375 RepID=G7WMM4_METH6|nr:hypothetical protein Mhar_0422 [Methanothrix harundinacea 6Ac]